MRRLIDFIIAHSSIFVLVIYVTISTILLLCFNPYQQSVYLSSANEIIGKYNSAVDEITSYVGLRKINRELQKNNTELQIEVDYLKTRLQQLTGDTTLHSYSQGLIPVNQLLKVTQAIGVTTTNTQNYVTINCGENDGVHEGMGVINRSGVVGIISRTSSNYSLVISILNPKLRLSCKLKNSEYFGSLVWDGSSPYHAVLEELPRHVEFQKGDTIVTTGYSSVFPEGIMVGFVEETVPKEGDDFYTLRVKLSTDYFRLGDVCIISNPDSEERLKLQQQ